MSGQLDIQLPVRYYCGVPSGRPRGLVTENWQIDLARTSFVELHCWNVGCPGGPPVPEDFWVDMGSPQNHALAWGVMQEFAAPALQAARRARMAVAHVQPESIAGRYPELQPPLPEQASKQAPWGWSPVSSHASDRASKVHGQGYMDWPGWKELDVAGPMKPVSGEVMIATTDQFDAWLRTSNIDTLLYVGFCANLCILDSPAAMKAMSSRGYRCVLLREATLALEFAETVEQRINTAVAIRYVESWVGYSASALDYISAMARVA